MSVIKYRDEYLYNTTLLYGSIYSSFPCKADWSCFLKETGLRTQEVSHILTVKKWCQNGTSLNKNSIGLVEPIN